MSIEIEVKAYADDLEEVEESLKKLKAEFIEEEKQRDIYFSHPCKDFKKSDEALRLRYGKAGKAVLTYKGPKLDKASKTREEIKLNLAQNEIDSAEGILKRLGFSEVAVVTKVRRKYALEIEGNALKVCLDTVEGLGTFVEGEIEGEDIARGRELIMRIMAEFGLTRFERKSYLELLME